MRPGLHLPNYPIDQWTDKDKRVIEAARPAAVSLMAREHDRRVYDWLEAASAGWGYKILYVVRFGDGPQTPHSAAVHLDNALAQVPEAVLAEDRAVFRLGTNSDKPEEWGDLPSYRYAFVELARLRPGVRLVTTNLHDPARWGEIAECAEHAHGLGAELYGANGDPAQIQALIDTGKPIYVVECGTLLYTHRQRGTWIDWRFEQYAALKFATAIWFIAGGRAYGSWPEDYVLSEEEAGYLGATTERLMTAQPIELPKPAPVPIPPADDPWLDSWVDFGGLRVRDLRAHFPEIGDRRYERRELAEIDEFVVHHSTGAVPTTPAAALQLSESIDRYHRTPRPPDWPGAPCIAYWAGGDGAGEVWLYNDPVIVGWCHGPDHNRRGLAYVWLGDYRDRTPADAVLEATVAAWKAAETVVGHPLRLLGHQEAMPGQTVCPSTLWPQIKERLIQMKGGTAPKTDMREAIRPYLDEIWEVAQIERQLAATHIELAARHEAAVAGIKRVMGFTD